MENLITIRQTDGGERVVSARELHENLQVKTQFTLWFERLLEYGFVENKDFSLVNRKRITNNPKNSSATFCDFAITLDMAKEVCMIQRTERGKKFREYFIQCEKQLMEQNALSAPSYQIEDPIARAEKWIAEQREAQRAIIEKDATISQQQRQLESQAPKVVFADAVTASDKSILVSELAKILTQNGFPIGQNRLYELLRRDGYLCHRGACYNQPTQRAMELGLFELKQTAITKPNGSIQTVTTTKVSGKGSVYFINRYLPHRVIAQNFKNQNSNAIPNC